MDSPKISVAVPTYNGASHLRETLVSILQSDAFAELFIVDDRSDDATVALAKDLIGDHGQVIVNSERLGLANNWNHCVVQSKHPLISIFHQDDLMLPGHLEMHLAAYTQNPNFGWVASSVEVIDQSGSPIPHNIVDRGGLGSSDLDLETDRGVDLLAISNPLRCSAVTINRSAFEEVGGFDPSYRYVVDWDFWVRVANVRPVAWRARRSVALRWHDASETHRFASGTVDLDETARLLEWIDNHLDIYSQDYSNCRVEADRRLARAFLNRAHVGFKQGDVELTRRALLKSVRLAPKSMLFALLRDPRLLAQMGIAFLLPRGVKSQNRALTCTDKSSAS